MPSSTSSGNVEWFRYPFAATHDLAKTWLTTETLLGLAPNTLDAYARGLDDFLGFCQKANISPTTATRADLARYVGVLVYRLIKVLLISLHRLVYPMQLFNSD